MPIFDRDIPRLVIPPVITKKLKVCLTEILSATHFWFYFIGPRHSQALNAMNRDMTKYYKLRDDDYRIYDKSEIVPGLAVATKYPGNVTFNRGIVKSVNVSDFEATIFFCDYGSVANIHVSELWFLEEPYGNLEQQAVLGRIWGLDAKTETDAGFKLLVDLALSSVQGFEAKIMVGTLIGPTPSPLPLVLRDINRDKNIAKLFVKKGLVKYQLMKKEDLEQKLKNEALYSDLLYEQTFYKERLLGEMRKLNDPATERMERVLLEIIEENDKKLKEWNKEMSSDSTEFSPPYLVEVLDCPSSCEPRAKSFSRFPQLKKPRSLINHEFKVLRISSNPDKFQVDEEEREPERTKVKDNLEKFEVNEKIKKVKTDKEIKGNKKESTSCEAPKHCVEKEKTDKSKKKMKPTKEPHEKAKTEKSKKSVKATKKPNKEKNDLRSVMKSNPTLTQEILSVMLKQPADVASIILKDYKTHVSKKKNPIKKTELDPDLDKNSQIVSKSKVCIQVLKLPGGTDLRLVKINNKTWVSSQDIVQLFPAIRAHPMNSLDRLLKCKKLDIERLMVCKDQGEIWEGLKDCKDQDKIGEGMKDPLEQEEEKILYSLNHLPLIIRALSQSPASAEVLIGMINSNMC
ncbi:uncharacterized protein LOC111712394 isoform X2 [Eurytemora carolleeae]|uniref:uncharacterized protein LOC111712394 isoform X2 n=1 Tax=Eurytemora carolleeae TaxID=1294199 RepID=UPI000C78E21B|nr:uncharacterized protein LOC111712394 isoform X2 [Eurytemora carolleeae]|eukprot:XP_023342751.1 uncharacterized protein LOC111712394 isoform X2 [Eurytemora affinis]